MEIKLPELVKRTSPEIAVSEVATKSAEVQTTPKPTKSVEAQQVEQPKVAPKVSPKRPSILNLGALLSQEEKPLEGVATVQSTVTESTIDTQAAQKLERARGAILEYLGQWRPRFIAVFEPMTFAQSVINITVPTTELRDEIMRSKTEFLTRVKELSKVTGGVELNIEVNESQKSLKPIKLEDRIAHIMGLNPLIEELCKALDLDIEG